MHPWSASTPTSPPDRASPPIQARPPIRASPPIRARPPILASPPILDGTPALPARVLLAGAALLAGIVPAAGVVLLTGTPARAAAVFVEANPSTVPAGDEVGLRASCNDNRKDAVVTGAPGGSVTVVPRFGFLTATVRIPKDARTGNVTLRLRCPDGARARTTLHVVARDRPARGPATGGGGTAVEPAARVLVGGGLTALAGGLALGLVALRRRRAG